MSGFTGPKDMDGILTNAMKCLEVAEKIPKARIRECSGLLLMNAKEVGIGISIQDASGVLVARDGEKWTPPAAMAITGVGAGALGYAEKKTMFVLNDAAIKSVLEHVGGTIKFGADAGLTNYLGGEVGADAALTKQGLATSYAYSSSEGGIVSLEVESCVVKPMNKVNEEFYGKTAAEILAGDADIPKGSKATELMDKVEEIGQKAAAEEEKGK